MSINSKQTTENQELENSTIKYLIIPLFVNKFSKKEFIKQTIDRNI